jgi:predicted Zn-dependent peptidase
LGRPILGEEETLRPVTVTTLEQFRDMHMSPERVVVSIAGGFDRDAFLDAVTERFGGLEAKTKQHFESARAHPGAAHETRKLEQTHLVLSWPAPRAGSDDGMSARLLSEIFGGGMASRLFQEVRESRGLVYAIDSFVDAVEDDGRLMVYAGCATENAAEVARIVSHELAELAAHGPRPEEVRRAKAIAGAQLLMGLEAPSARAEARAGQIILRGRLIELDEIRAKLDAVSAESIKKIAEAALKGPACAAAIGPKGGHGALGAFHAHS